jgi:hypothetical protein
MVHVVLVAIPLTVPPTKFGLNYARKAHTHLDDIHDEHPMGLAVSAIYIR